MSRYIDADLLLAQCRRNPLFEKTEEDKRMVYIERSIIDATPTANVAPIADTVRKMHSKIKKRCIEGGIYPAFVARTIDKIAKEMLEEL